MSRLSIWAFPFLEKFVLFTLHKTFILEGLAFFGTNWLVNVRAITWVHTGSFMFDHLMTTFDCAFILICRSILPTNWGELVLTRTIEMGRLCPVEVITRPLVGKSNIGAF
jgi:hypothetical protein